jgi:5-formyltetrahydrofolate cyclo-ligase
MNAEKSALRQELIQAREGLSDAERTLQSRAIVDRLIETADWSQVKTIHYFEPLRALFEVDISGLVTYLEDNFPEIELFTPKLIGGVWEMISIQRDAAPDNFGVIIVPMLGFDPKTLHRIGYGGGYYDKFLATQAAARKIGVCFEVGKSGNLPVEPHDIPLDLVVTEEKTYTVSNGNRG